MALSIAVLDACFAPDKQASRGLAARYLDWDLRRNRATPARPCDADVILVTCVHPEQANYLARCKATYKKALVVAGGPASTSPHALGAACDAVCVGDGQAFVRALASGGIESALSLPNVWQDGVGLPVQVDQSFPWGMPPMQAEDGAYRLWCGRGCKKRCAFCQTGWAYEYAEHPQPDALIAQARTLKAKGHKIGYVSNDPMQHAFWAALPAVEHGSYSLDFIRRHGLPPARQIRLGVEGVSERLRRFVCKPISHSDLVQASAWLCGSGKSVRWFMIAGLPGEADSDWQELREAVQEWKRCAPKGVLALSFTAWCPEPASPLGVFAVTDDYWPRYEAFREWFFGGRGWSNRVKLMGPQQPGARIRKAEAQMGLPAVALRRGGDRGPNWRVAYPHKAQCEAVTSKMLRLAGCDQLEGGGAAPTAAL